MLLGQQVHTRQGNPQDQWTGHTDDFATEYYNPTFSRLVWGNYSIYGATLHVDVHILDTIGFCWPLESEDTTQVVSDLEHLFKRKGRTILDRYIDEDLKLEQVLGKVSRKLRPHPSLSQFILNSSSVADAGASPSLSNASVTSIIHGLRFVK